MSSQAFDMVPIQNENDGKVLGVLTEGTFALPSSSVRPVLSCLPSLILSINTERSISISAVNLISYSFLLCSVPSLTHPFCSFSLCPIQHITSVSGNLTSMMTQGRIQPDEMCVGAMYKQFRQVQLSTSLCELANIFDRSVRNNVGIQEVTGSMSGEWLWHYQPEERRGEEVVDRK